ncbi:unnamed protein product [Ilex paraguariensis]|uniref:Uncharacterized protein n=1 Tax=Ilex paraguariensis TaxID=185542 RepID=A0ABC8QUB6_9AQUA
MMRRSTCLIGKQVGGVHSHLISRVQRNKSRVGCFMSQNEIMTTVFPMFQQHIEPHLVHAHLKIRNDFDPVLSPESSLFMLKSNKQVAYQDILKILDPAKICSSVQNFIDIYLRLPGIPANGQLTESDCIRVRICEGRFALLIREPIREGNFINQPKVDFDISINTVAGLLNLGCNIVNILLRGTQKIMFHHFRIEERSLRRVAMLSWHNAYSLNHIYARYSTSSSMQMYSLPLNCGELLESDNKSLCPEIPYVSTECRD